MTDWQPIETFYADPDQDILLLYDAKTDEFTRYGMDGDYFYRNGRWMAPDFTYGDLSVAYIEVNYQPTHWLLCPEVPITLNRKKKNVLD